MLFCLRKRINIDLRENWRLSYLGMLKLFNIEFLLFILILLYAVRKMHFYIVK